MTSYTNVKVNISEGQKEKLQHPIKAGCSAVSIHLGHKDLEVNDILAVTNSQAKKLVKAHENGKGITIRKFKPTQTLHENRGWFSQSFSRISRDSSTDVRENRFTSMWCWRFFQVSLIGSTKSDGVRSLPQERRMR